MLKSIVILFAFLFVFSNFLEVFFLAEKNVERQKNKIILIFETQNYRTKNEIK